MKFLAGIIFFCLTGQNSNAQTMHSILHVKEVDKIETILASAGMEAILKKNHFL